MTDPDRLPAFEAYRRATGRAENTLRTHGSVLRRLGEVYDLDTVTTAELVDWLAGHRWAPQSRAAARTAVRAYFRWAVRVAKLRLDDPAAELDSVPLPPPCPRPVPEDALTAALAAADPETWLMVALAAYAGLRVAELSSLRREHLEGDLLRVTGKGGRTRIVPIGGELLARLTACPPGYIFPGRFPGTHMRPDSAAGKVRDLLPPGYTTHKLRHRYATRVYSRSHDLLVTSQLLGHSNPATTRLYVELDTDDLRRVAATAL